MTKKLNSMPDYRAKMPRQPHDVSQSTAYTCCPGALNPVYYDMLHTGDELFFSASQFTRLNPMVTQALGQIDVHLDYFFVPLTVMYTPSSSLFYQTDDLLSSLVDKDTLNKTNFPVCDLANYVFDILPSANAHYGISSLLPSQFDCLLKSVVRMIDFLDLSVDGVLALISNGAPISTYPKFTPWFALAYQAVYQLYYRNDDREVKNYHYNIDKYYNGDDIELSRAKKSIFEINYVSRAKDYFNSVKVSPISSSTSLLSASALDDLYSQTNLWLSNSINRIADSDNVDIALGQYSTAVRNEDNFVNTGAIRSMFMVEKLLRVIGRSEKNYESQFLAHYGIKIPHDVMHNITHIGHDMVSLNPESVRSTANTYDSATGQGSALGEIGGQCSGMLTGSKKSFTAPFHGVFLCISHIVPRRRYVLGLNKLHMLNSPDKFWQPEFDKKGMEPIFGYEAYFYGDEDLSVRLGWQFAYEMFKRKSDRVMRAFKPSPNQRYLVNTYAPWVISSVPYGHLLNDGSNRYIFNDTIEPYDLLVSPNDLNVNMIVPHSTASPEPDGDGQYQPWTFYQTDPFICDFNLNCKKVNMMSEYGEPEL